MAVYVDNMRSKYGRMIMCHMIADTSVELAAMAVKLQIPLKWMQKQGTPEEHYDICLSKKKLAIKYYGAKEITSKELINKIKVKRWVKSNLTNY